MKKISLYARKRMHKPEPDKLAPLRLLDIARPYEPGEMVEEHVATKAAYIRLRDGDGSMNPILYLIGFIVAVALWLLFVQPYVGF